MSNDVCYSFYSDGRPNHVAPRNVPIYSTAVPPYNSMFKINYDSLVVQM